MGEQLFEENHENDDNEIKALKLKLKHERKILKLKFKHEQYQYETSTNDNRLYCKKCSSEITNNLKNKF